MVGKDYLKEEEYCGRAVLVSPNDGNVLAMYAELVWMIHKDLSQQGKLSDGQPSSFSEWILPAKEFDGLWESLIYESGLKQRLLRYAASALLFTQKGVNPNLVS
ncbi:unnamed protein product [Eruca vesicaria subsp. sativa]|uniref:Pachytene checkpoint protein 2 homolog n=1 Tax=Eruca vesicaria subsp. sativa TaxID=29727 RepID=A0ABC8KP08_ERUVS|nr:unnamed protein product [Eruca vesicaria subsp. sativa]